MSSLPAPGSLSAAPGEARATIANGTDERLALLLMAGAILLEVLLVLLLPVFVTVDGAVHVGGAATLRDAWTGHGALVDQYLIPSYVPAPNLLPELGMAVAMLLFPPAAAEKLLIVGYLVALPVSLWYAVRGLRPDAGWLALVALPLTFSLTFLYGFFNFSYSVAVFLVVAGYALRHRDGLTGRPALVLIALLAIAYLTHLIGFLMAVVLVAALVGTHALAGLGGTPDERRASVRRLAILAIILTPPLLAAAAFLIVTSSAVPKDASGLLRPVLGTVSLIWGVVSYDVREIPVCIALAAILGLATLAALRARTRPWRLAMTDVLAVFALLTTVAVAFIPDAVASGGGFATQRIALFAAYGLVLWLAAQPLARHWLRAVGVGAVAAALLLGLFRLPTYQRLADAADAYTGLEACVARQSTMVQINLALLVPGSLERLDPLTAETGRLTAATRGLDLGSVEWGVPFYPFRFRDELDPKTYLIRAADGIEAVPPDIDPLGYEQATTGRVDYIVVVGRDEADPATLASPEWTAVEAQLATGYRLVAASSVGRAEVYERLQSPAAQAGDVRRSQAPPGACIRS